MNFDDAKETFRAEAGELLEEMETALLGIEARTADPELVNAIFRAAHTLKGSGGIFGFDRLERFTHRVESVLDRVRNGALAIDKALVALLLECRDLLAVLVEAEVTESSLDETTENTIKLVLSRLDELLRRDDTVAASSHSEHWYLDIRFDGDVVRNGLEPLALIRYLEQSGALIRVVPGLETIPEPTSFDPERCYVELGLVVDGRTDRGDIEGAIEFFREDATVVLIPPGEWKDVHIGMLGGDQAVARRVLNRMVAAGVASGEERERLLSNEREALALPERGGPTEEGSEARAASNSTHGEGHRQAGRRTLRIDADKLDRLINLVGELVIAGAATHVIAKKLGDEGLMEANSALNRLVEEIRDNALRLRMVQIGDTFNRFHRVVRDVSQELGKSIRLVVAGDDTELDKTVVEKIGDPLMHLLRNAMDHGIEAEADRVAAGKTAQGTVRLNAYHDSGSIVIEVSDDGRGLNLDAVKAKAIAAGLVAANQSLSAMELQRLIFEPGITTANAVTNLSGRGVGMDVVRRNIEALRGTVEVESAAGEGAKFTIRLPLTLAIIDGFLVRIGEAPYVIPLDMVHECIELAETEQSALGNDSRYINLRGEVLPYLVLRELFGDAEERGPRENIVVVHHGGRKAGLVVDLLLGEMQTVIKPLGKVFQQLIGISGATILGSGEVAVILDVPQLVQMASVKDQRHARVALQPV